MNFPKNVNNSKGVTDLETSENQSDPSLILKDSSLLKKSQQNVKDQTKNGRKRSKIG